LDRGGEVAAQLRLGDGAQVLKDEHGVHGVGDAVDEVREDQQHEVQPLDLRPLELERMVLFGKCLRLKNAAFAQNAFAQNAHPVYDTLIVILVFMKNVSADFRLKIAFEKKYTAHLNSNPFFCHKKINKIFFDKSVPSKKNCH
jgi:hypothetical protein